MVGLIERFRKPKSPVVLGSPQEDDIIPSQTPATPQSLTPLILRNFSYPTSIGNNNQSISAPPPPRGGQSTWDQLGEICSFSPDSGSRIGQAGTARIEDPFFFKSDRASYCPLIDQSDNFEANPQPHRQYHPVSPSQEEPKTRKKQRRSTLLRPKLPKSQSIGDHIFSQKSTVVAKLKRNSLSQHKTTSSLNATHFISLPYTGPERPVSSSGIPLVDTRLKHSSSVSQVGHSLLSLPQESIQDISTRLDEETSVSKATSTLQSPRMDSTHRKVASYGQLEFTDDASRNSGGRRRNVSVSESAKSRGKLGKSRWLSQLKDWVSVSEPSSQALKNYKKETYQKAGIAFDDPRANAKLHLPVGTLPSDAIKPAGPGPDPEEIVFKRSEQRKKMRESLTGVGITSRASRSSSRHHSSSSTVAFGSPREDIWQ
ncbi:hypothetical protein F5X99DRAFT_408764 [Biscogniauxia marginata]|nr:hypothetical protein F5X99DRAFT_408764 [Biscogniauxia marginata]